MMIRARNWNSKQGNKMEQAAMKDNGKDFYDAVADNYRQSSKTMGKEYFVLDGDRHLIEPLGAFTKYLDKEFLDRAPTVVTDNGGGIRFLVEDRMYQKPVGWGLGRPEGNSDYRPRGVSLTRDEAVQHALDKRDEDMDITGVDIGMWIPTGGLFLPDIVDIDLQYALMRALNDWTGKDYCCRQAPYVVRRHAHRPQTGGGGGEALQGIGCPLHVDSAKRHARRPLVDRKTGIPFGRR